MQADEFNTGAGSATSNIPEAIHNAIAEFSRRSTLDETKLLAGDRFDIKGVGFRLHHYGHADPAAVVVMVEVGAFTDGLVAEALAELLIQNFTRPAGLAGYFSLIPVVNTVALCIRVEVTDAGAGCDAIANVVAGVATGVQDMFKVIQTELAKSEAQPA